ncbi:MAG: YHS domain-containing (seleno)protein [Bacteroidota bacterium]
MKTNLLALGLILFSSIAVFAQKSPVFITDGSAIHGYDAVAYFKDGKAVKGDSHFSFSWNAGNWFFANKENLDAFKANPEKYAPQYGGYCAYGLADGHKAPTDPDAWMIVGGKLYLNYNKDVQQKWLKKQQEFIQTADKNWPALKDKE